MRTCRVCGKEQRRSHHHADPGYVLRRRYGRFVAEQERVWIRTIFRRAEVESPRMLGTNDTVVSNP